MTLMKPIFVLFLVFILFTIFVAPAGSDLKGPICYAVCQATGAAVCAASLIFFVECEAAFQVLFF
jgi:hypothetical protein